MKTQFTFLIIIFCLNLSILITVNAKQSDGVTPLIPGLAYSQPLNATGDISDYEERLNATELIEGWSGTQDVDYSNIGDSFSGLSDFWNTFRFLIDGLGALLDYIGSMFTSGLSAFNLISWGIRGVSAVMFVTLVIEFISGRELLP